MESTLNLQGKRFHWSKHSLVITKITCHFFGKKVSPISLKNCVGHDKNLEFSKICLENIQYCKLMANIVKDLTAIGNVSNNCQLSCFLNTGPAYKRIIWTRINELFHSCYSKNFGEKTLEHFSLETFLKLLENVFLFP